MGTLRVDGYAPGRVEFDGRYVDGGGGLPAGDVGDGGGEGLGGGVIGEGEGGRWWGSRRCRGW